MAKTLNQFLEGYLKVKNPDEQKFVDKHVTAKHPDRNGNGDEVFNGSKVKTADRRKDRHGYNPGEDEKVYEELKGSQHKIDANKNGKVDAHDFKLLRKKKKVAEEVEELDEVAAEIDSIRKTLQSRMNRIYTPNHPEKKDSARLRSKLQRLKKKQAAMKEEAEQIDELDTATLKSYRTKARAQGNAIVDKMKMGGGDWSKDQKDTKTLRKRAAGANMSGKQLVKRGESLKTEEVEQVDEISKATMGRYINKAKDSIDLTSYRQGHRDSKGFPTSKPMERKLSKRHGGIELAVKKLTKEDAEQIDELSKNTLATYAIKAKNQMGRDEARAGYQRGIRHMDGKGQGEMERAHDKRAEKRSKGIDTALNKLAKEEAELEEKINMDKASMRTVIKDFQKSDAPQFKGKSQDKRRAMAIAAKLTAERGGKPLNKEEKLADLLGDLTESHKRTMLAVFDKLNESNQKKFLEACVTPEGVEQMLDFSISHRGE